MALLSCWTDIGLRLPNAHALRREVNCNILMVDYRGYGLSEGTPSEQGLMMDADVSSGCLRLIPMHLAVYPLRWGKKAESCSVHGCHCLEFVCLLSVPPMRLGRATCCLC